MTLGVGAGPSERRRPATSRLSEFGTTIFAEMSALAVESGSINLGQGFPDTDGPDEVKEAAIAAIRDGFNQYPPGRGIPELLDAVSAHQARFYGLDFDPGSEVLVTAGATEALTSAILSLCQPGDEVIVFEPYYDSYVAAISLAGAVRRVVPLRPPRWDFDPDELRRAVSARTRLLLLNTPHNPSGKVFSRDELSCIAEIAQERDLVVVTDEVYEHLVFDGIHLPIASLPGMRDRTLTISSAGKSFSFTGWKVGWAVGPSDLVSAVQSVKQFLTYVNGAPFQRAVVTALALSDRYFDDLRASLRSRRDLLAAGLAGIGLAVLPTAGTYFLNTDISSLTAEDALTFCRLLPEACGVVAVPCSVFFDSQSLGSTLVRWAFCKREELLREALVRLGSLSR